MPLNTPIFEVLENIFLYFVDLRDLIAAQRVCRAWKEIIHESTPLQEKMFLKPNREMETRGVYKINPLAPEIFAARGLVQLSRDSYRREEASWRPMFVFQPPLNDGCLTLIQWAESRYSWMLTEKVSDQGLNHCQKLRCDIPPRILERLQEYHELISLLSSFVRGSTEPSSLKE